VAWFDVGVNLTDKRFNGKVNDILNTASQNGVSHILVIGTSLEDSLAAVALSKLCSDFNLTLKCTAGFHPHQAKSAKVGDMERLRELFEDDNFVAVGECGLDFNRNFSPPDVQLSIFEQQLALLKKYESKIKGGLVHCFTGNTQQLESYLELGLSIGITGWVCDPERGIALREAIKHLPLDRMLVETDAPYLTPKNIRPRPKFNQPSFVPHVAQSIADIKGVSLADVEKCSFDNASQLFSISSESA
jgi:TatD DNase family protein